VGRKETPTRPSLIPTLQVVEGPGVGRWHRFSPTEVTALTVGRTTDAQFVIEHPTVSRCHARFTWLRMGAEFFMHMEDLQSTNGSTVNGEKIASVYLKEGDLVALGDVILRFQLLSPGELSERDRLVARATLAETDPLTGLGTRLYMEEQVPKLCSECDSRQIALSLLVIDLDHFKRVNDTLGHPVGDEVLAAMGRVVLSSIRDSDVAVRFGGEEFLAFLPGSDLDKAAMVAERLRSSIAAFDATAIAPGRKLTASVGVAQRGPAETFDALLGRADEALYRAKLGGRDRIEIDRREPSSTPAAAG
jgi:diguanylate cyclase (GGDEF)-like protein